MRVYRNDRADVLTRERTRVFGTPNGERVVDGRIVFCGREAESWPMIGVACVVGSAVLARTGTTVRMQRASRLSERLWGDVEEPVVALR